MELAEEVSFAYFDNLYVGQNDQYAEMLDLYCQEYKDYHSGIIEALKNSDIEKFRRIKHKIIYSLHLLSLNQFRNRLEEIAPILSFSAEAQRSAYAQELDNQFSLLLQTISHKRDKLNLTDSN